VKILLVGGSGQLGGDIARNNVAHEIFAPSRDALDLERMADVGRLVTRFAPDLVLNCAAFHNVPQCEEQPEKAFRVNCIAVRDLARLCRQRDIAFVTFSSNYVFGGEQRKPYTEMCCPDPLQVYGISRLAGELAARSTAPDLAVIIRTCGLYGISGARSKGGNFVDSRVTDARAGGDLEVSCEQIVCPTSTDDLSAAVLRLIDHADFKPGIYHLVNEGECSWYEFTKAIYSELNCDANLRAVDRKGLSGEMRRPLYSVLENTRARSMGITLPPWRDALHRYMHAKYAQHV
jgi:dTDP-4-dehydrorhamnose reductase